MKFQFRNLSEIRFRWRLCIRKSFEGTALATIAVALMAWLSSPMQPASAANPKRPNMVFIMADDKYDYLTAAIEKFTDYSGKSDILHPMKPLGIALNSG